MWLQDSHPRYLQLSPVGREFYRAALLLSERQGHPGQLIGDEAGQVPVDQATYIDGAPEVVGSGLLRILRDSANDVLELPAVLDGQRIWVAGGRVR